eukprot:114104_1
MEVNPFVSHMTLDEASKLRVGDKVDYRDNLGRFGDCTVIEKNGCELILTYAKIRPSEPKTWCNYLTETERLANPGSISLRPAHRFKSLQKNDHMDINPVRKDPGAGWTRGKVKFWDKTKHSGQICFVYTINGNNRLYWVHVDDVSEIAPCDSMQSSINQAQTSTTLCCSDFGQVTKYRLNVLRYSYKKLNEIKKQYQSEIENRNNICISAADPLTETDYDSNRNLMDTNKRWTHGISCAIFRIIFERCTFDPESRDKTVLILVQVCKSWRDVIMSVDSQTSLRLFNGLWSGCLPNFRADTLFEWKHLVLIPKPYLSLVVDIKDVYLEPFTQVDNRIYRALCAGYDAQVAERLLHEEVVSLDSNMWLWMQIFIHCPRIYQFDPMGTLCEDLFHVLCRTGFDLQSLNFQYCDMGEQRGSTGAFMHGFSTLWGKRFDDIQANNSSVILCKLRSIELNCCKFDFGLGIFGCRFRNIIKEIELSKTYVDGDELQFLFKHCTELEYLHVWRGTSSDGTWKKAFRTLARTNKVITYIFIDEVYEWDNECCRLFSKAEVCPKLSRLHLNGYGSATEKMIEKMKKKRQNVGICVCLANW